MTKYLLNILLLLSLTSAMAQNKYRRDTVYYLMDTLHTLPNDRMWNVDVEDQGRIKLFAINCPCLPDGSQPMFEYYEKNKKTIKKDLLKKIKTISLPTLIKISRVEIGSLHTFPIIVFIEHGYDNTYTMNIVHLWKQLSHKQPVIDYITIPRSDTTKSE